MLRRYLVNERDQLTPWSPPPKGYSQLQGLLRRRKVLVQARVALRQSLAGLPGLQRSVEAMIRRMDRLDRLIQKRIRETLRSLEWDGQRQRCQAIEGVGPLTAAALILAFKRGAFRSSDAFVAFLGLDVRVRDSGKMRGRRKLTKKGDPELRRLLYLAAMTAARSDTWRELYQRYRDRGMSATQAYVVLARKLARIAFSLLKNQADYQPKLRKNLA